MSELRTEEEQLDAIKSWWKSNGVSLLIMIAVALSAVYGFKAWQNHQQETSEQASTLYQQLVTKITPAIGADEEKNVATSKHITKVLKEDFADTQYAKYASLLLAKVAVDSGDLLTALKELDWLLNNQDQPLLTSLASIRKAQILAAQNNTQEALSLLKKVTVEGLQVQAFELEGDIHLAQGDKVKARSAYEKALANENVGAAQSVISLKLNDLTNEEG